MCLFLSWMFYCVAKNRKRVTEVSSWFPLIESSKMTCDWSICGSWICCQTQRLRIVFRGITSCPYSLKQPYSLCWSHFLIKLLSLKTVARLIFYMRTYFAFGNNSSTFYKLLFFLKISNVNLCSGVIKSKPNICDGRFCENS